MKGKVAWTDSTDSPEEILSSDDDQSEAEDQDKNEGNDDQTLEVDCDELEINAHEPDNEIEENTITLCNQRYVMQIWIAVNHLRLQCQIGKVAKSQVTVCIKSSDTVSNK